ncbi:MAG: LptF/LptG family permease [Opitutaceae bacterium]|nr:LptF/LptG family permease [Opitutaceae bacterium]
MFKSVLGSCLAAVGLFGFVLMLGNAIRDLLGYVLSGQLPPAVFVQLLLLLVPFVISYALPMGILTGILLTLGRLSADSEITAMRAVGVSLGRVARPVLLLGVLGALTTLYVNFEAMPRARMEYQRQLAKVVETNPLGFVVPRTFIRDFPGFVIYIGAKEGDALRDFWLWELDAEQRVVRLVRAASGRFTYEPSDNSLLLTLQQAQVESRRPRDPEDFSAPPLVGTFDRTEQARLPLDSLFNRTPVEQKLKWMTIAELQAEWEALAVDPAADGAARRELDRLRWKLTVQDKLQGGLVVFAFALIGVPLGIKVSRRETSANLGVAVVIALGYHVMTAMVSSFDQRPDLRPDLLYWLPNLCLLALGVWLFSRIDRR